MPQAIRTSDIATGRTASLFQADLTNNDQTLRDHVAGKRILAIGAAGSIGSNTVRVFSRYAPAALHVVDQNENALAELVRQFRSQVELFDVADFSTLPLDYGSPAMLAFLQSEAPYDVILNFAAIKHVRSEKDPFSTLQMFDTNIIKQHRLLRWLEAITFSGRYFSVSTDKAANPSSLMGATKRVMEHIMFDTDHPRDFGVTTARFANVAFSNGSLLESFTNRLASNQPIACPQDIKRYFVSLEESGQICTLAAILAPDGHIAIPRLDPQDHLVLLKEIAVKFIEENGFTPKIYSDENAAKSSVETDKLCGYWPLLLTLGNTAGEKPFEEFIAKNEIAKEINLIAMQSISYVPSNGSVAEMMAKIEAMLSDLEGGDTQLSSDRLKDIIALLEPDFLKTHVQSDLNLDQRV